jgi:hypothetical protein
MMRPIFVGDLFDALRFDIASVQQQRNVLCYVSDYGIFSTQN